MKAIEVSKRHDHLILELTKINNWIETHIQSQIDIRGHGSQGTAGESPLGRGPLRNSAAPLGIKGNYRFNYHGLILPCEQGGGDDLDPLIIMKIIPELNQAFNTRERAPFKIVVETIRYSELKEQEERTQQQNVIFNSSPKNTDEPKMPALAEAKSVEVDKKCSLSEEAGSQNSNIIVSLEEEDNEDWQNISYTEFNLDGMSDPFANKFKNTIQEYKKLSKFSMKYESWGLKAMIVKANDDVRQEVLAIQLMRRLKEIFDAEGHPIYLYPYDIFVTSSNSGLLEFVPDTNSIDYLKKKFPSKDWTLKTFFDKYFVDDIDEARKCFVESLAGYSLFSYLFNVKDRHNGNILLDS